MRPTSSFDTPLAAASGGVRIRIRLSPRGRSDRIEGVARMADGAAVLKVAVTAPPTEGRANDALLQLLAREWRVPRRDLAIIGGQKSRHKIVHAAGEPAILLQRLGAALAALPES